MSFVEVASSFIDTSPKRDGEALEFFFVIIAEVSMKVVRAGSNTSMIGQLGVVSGKVCVGRKNNDVEPYVRELTVQTSRLFKGRSSEARRSSNVPSVNAVRAAHRIPSGHVHGGNRTLGGEELAGHFLGPRGHESRG